MDLPFSPYIVKFFIPFFHQKLRILQKLKYLLFHIEISALTTPVKQKIQFQKEFQICSMFRFTTVFVKEYDAESQLVCSVGFTDMTAPNCDGFVMFDKNHS